MADVHVSADSLNLVINETEPLIRPALNEIADSLSIGEKVKQARATKTASSQVRIVKRKNPTQQPNKQEAEDQFFLEQGTTRGKARNFPEFDKIEVFRDSVPPESVQEILPQASHAEEQEISAVEVHLAGLESGRIIKVSWEEQNTFEYRWKSEKSPTARSVPVRKRLEVES
nr:unnamed protein product [Callosobruchus chinensis]